MIDTAGVGICRTLAVHLNESKMRYLYEVAEIRVECFVPYPITIQWESEEFMKEINEDLEHLKYDFTMCFKNVSTLPEIQENGFEISCQYHLENKSEWRTYYRTSPGETPYACVVWSRGQDKHITCFFLEGKEMYLNYSRNITNHIGLENLLRVKKGLLLHAAFIRWKEKGILFSAPSGTGKSTQARLWNEYEGAEIVNGDRTAIRCINGTWKAYGLPYAGSSGIYRNESANIKAIVVLRQAAVNCIKKISVIEAIHYLYSEITIHRWDKEFIDETVEIMKVLFSEIPVFLLECRPEYEAVAILKKAIEDNAV